MQVTIEELLKRRDYREKESFSIILKAYRSTIELLDKLNDELHSNRLLDNRFNSLKQERQELLNFNVDLQKQMEKSINTINLKNAEIERLKAASKKINDAEWQELLNEKNFNIRLIQDELTALQLELLSLDKQKNELEEQNKNLIDRLVERMNLNAIRIEDEEGNGNEEEEDGNVYNGQDENSSTDTINKKDSNRNNNNNGNAIKRSIKHQEPVLIEHKRISSDIKCVAYNPNNGILVFINRDNELRNEHDSLLIRHLPTPISLLCSKDYLIACASSIPAEPILVYNFHTKRVMTALHGHRQNIIMMDISSRIVGIGTEDDTIMLVSLCSDGIVKVWDIQRSMCLRTISNDSKYKIESFCISKDYHLILLFVDGSIKLYDNINNLLLKPNNEIMGIHDFDGKVCLVKRDCLEFHTFIPNIKNIKYLKTIMNIKPKNIAPVKIGSDYIGVLDEENDICIFKHNCTEYSKIRKRENILLFYWQMDKLKALGESGILYTYNITHK